MTSEVKNLVCTVRKLAFYALFSLSVLFPSFSHAENSNRPLVISVISPSFTMDIVASSSEQQDPGNGDGEGDGDGSTDGDGGTGDDNTGDDNNVLVKKAILISSIYPFITMKTGRSGIGSDDKRSDNEKQETLKNTPLPIDEQSANLLISALTVDHTDTLEFPVAFDDIPEEQICLPN